VRRKDEIETRQLALVLRPGFPIVRATPFKKAAQLGVARHHPGIDADGVGQDCGHIGPPRGPAVPACIIGGEPPAFLQLASGLIKGRWMDRLWGILGEIPEDKLTF